MPNFERPKFELTGSVCFDKLTGREFSRLSPQTFRLPEGFDETFQTSLLVGDTAGIYDPLKVQEQAR